LAFNRRTALLDVGAKRVERVAVVHTAKLRRALCCVAIAERTIWQLAKGIEYPLARGTLRALSA